MTRLNNYYNKLYNLILIVNWYNSYNIIKGYNKSLIVKGYINRRVVLSSDIIKV